MWKIRWIGGVSVVCSLILMTMLGCETYEDTSATSDVSGSWLYSDTDGRQSTWALVQSDDDTVVGAGTGGETISGSVSGDTIYMSLTYSSSSSSASLNGTVSGNTMSGSFTNSASGNGSWIAVQTN